MNNTNTKRCQSPVFRSRKGKALALAGLTGIGSLIMAACPTEVEYKEIQVPVKTDTYKVFLVEQEIIVKDCKVGEQRPAYIDKIQQGLMRFVERGKDNGTYDYNLTYLKSFNNNVEIIIKKSAGDKVKAVIENNVCIFTVDYDYINADATTYKMFSGDFSQAISVMQMVNAGVSVTSLERA